MPSLLSPLFLVGALAAAVSVVLHLLKRNPEPRVKFAAVALAPAGNDVAIVTFSDRADLVLRPTADRALALAAIDGATAGFGGTRYLAGMNMAGQAVAGRPGKMVTIVVVTDLQENGWDAGDRASVPESARVEIRDVGPLPENLAVVGVRAEGDRVVATVRNAGARTRETHVRLTVDGRAAGVVSVSLGPQGSAEAVFPSVSGT